MDLLIGQCACGATLTQYHVLYECPLRPQDPVVTSRNRVALEQLVKHALESMADDSKVAERGYN